MSDTLRSMIESLPNELWREIFDYFPGNKLFIAFYGLNNRINGLLADNTNLCLKLEGEQDYKYVMGTILPSSFTTFSNVKALTMRSVDEQIRFRLHYPLNLFTQLRSLKWSYVSPTFDSGFEHITTLKHLESLEIKFLGDEREEVTRLMDIMFFRPNSTLSCTLTHFSCFIHRVVLWSQLKQFAAIERTTNLQYLDIRWVDYEDFLWIFPSLVQVKSISVGLVGKETSPLPTIPTHTELRHCTNLNLDLRGILGNNVIKTIVQYTRNLKQLIIASSIVALGQSEEQ